MNSASYTGEDKFESAEGVDNTNYIHFVDTVSPGRTNSICQSDWDSKTSSINLTFSDLFMPNNFRENFDQQLCSYSQSSFNSTNAQPVPESFNSSNFPYTTANDCSVYQPKHHDAMELTSSLSPTTQLTPSQVKELIADLQCDRSADDGKLLPGLSSDENDLFSTAVVLPSENSVITILDVNDEQHSFDRNCPVEHVYGSTTVENEAYTMMVPELESSVASAFFDEVSTSLLPSRGSVLGRESITDTGSNTLFACNNLQNRVAIDESDSNVSSKRPNLKDISCSCGCWPCADDHLCGTKVYGPSEQKLTSASTVLPTLRSLLQPENLEESNIALPVCEAEAPCTKRYSCNDHTLVCTMDAVAEPTLQHPLLHNESSNGVPHLHSSLYSNSSFDSMTALISSQSCCHNSLNDGCNVQECSLPEEGNFRSVRAVDYVRVLCENEDTQIFTQKYGDLRLDESSIALADAAPLPSATFEPSMNSTTISLTTDPTPEFLESGSYESTEQDGFAYEQLAVSSRTSFDASKDNNSPATPLNQTIVYDDFRDANMLIPDKVNDLWGNAHDTAVNSSVCDYQSVPFCSVNISSSRTDATPLVIQQQRTMRRSSTVCTSRPRSSQLLLTKMAKSSVPLRHSSRLVLTENPVRDNSSVAHNFYGSHRKLNFTAHSYDRPMESQMRGHMNVTGSAARQLCPTTAKCHPSGVRSTCTPFSHRRKRAARPSPPFVSTIVANYSRRKHPPGANLSRLATPTGSAHHLYRILTSSTSISDSTSSTFSSCVTTTSANNPLFTASSIGHDRKSSHTCEHGNSSVVPFNPSTFSAVTPSPHQYFPEYSTRHRCRLVITQQPEAQHRARYQTEGSRGAIKDRLGTGYPTVQLIGWNGRASLHVFVASEHGRPKPHSFYEAYLVPGKSSKYCVQTVRDGVTMIEMPFPCSHDRTLSVESVGILKLRKTDVEQRSQSSSLGPRCRIADSSVKVTQSMAKTASRKTGKARLVFRAMLYHERSGAVDVIQVASDPILCTQLVGDPDISRISTSECSVSGGSDLFILGKNLGKDSRVLFRQLVTESSVESNVKVEDVVGQSNSHGDVNQTNVLWHKEAILESEFSHQTHLVCRIPAYDGPSCPLSHPLTVQLIVCTGQRCSIPLPFVYKPIPSQHLSIPPNCYLSSNSLLPDSVHVVVGDSMIPTRDSSSPDVPSPSSTYLMQSILPIASKSFEYAHVSRSSSKLHRTSSFSDVLVPSGATHFADITLSYAQTEQAQAEPSFQLPQVSSIYPADAYSSTCSNQPYHDMSTLFSNIAEQQQNSDHLTGTMSVSSESIYGLPQLGPLPSVDGITAQETDDAPHLQ